MSPMNLFATEHPLCGRRPGGRLELVACAILLALGVATLLLVRHVAGPRVVARLAAPDGTEMCVVQQFNWSFEPFTTSFVYRRPGAPWGRFYYDHQDDYWGSSRAVLDTNRGVAIFYRGNTKAIDFSWATETYTLHRSTRTVTGAQWQMPGDWSPARPVYCPR